MVISGSYFKCGKFWVADLPVIDASTQARRKDGLPKMIADLFSSLSDRRIRMVVTLGNFGEITIEAFKDEILFPLILRRQREMSGLSQKEAARTLGYASVNAYAAYEQGQRHPSLDKAERLLRAVGGKRKLRIAIG